MAQRLAVPQPVGPASFRCYNAGNIWLTGSRLPPAFAGPAPAKIPQGSSRRCLRKPATLWLRLNLRASSKLPGKTPTPRNGTSPPPSVFAARTGKPKLRKLRFASVRKYPQPPLPNRPPMSTLLRRSSNLTLLRCPQCKKRLWQTLQVHPRRRLTPNKFPQRPQRMITNRTEKSDVAVADGVVAIAVGASLAPRPHPLRPAPLVLLRQLPKSRVPPQAKHHRKLNLAVWLIRGRFPLFLSNPLPSPSPACAAAPVIPDSLQGCLPSRCNFAAC